MYISLQFSAVHKLQGHEDWIRGLQFVVDGKYIFSVPYFLQSSKFIYVYFVVNVRITIHIISKLDITCTSIWKVAVLLAPDSELK